MRSYSARLRISLALVIAMIGGMVVSANVFAQAPAAAAPGLDTLMGTINRQYRLVKTQVADKAQNAKTLDALTALQTATTAAKGMTPASLAKLPDAEKAAKLTEYRKGMAALLRALVEMEEFILADDNTKAAAMVPKIDEIQKAGHTAFRVD